MLEPMYLLENPERDLCNRCLCLKCSTVFQSTVSSEQETMEAMY